MHKISAPLVAALVLVSAPHAGAAGDGAAADEAEAEAGAGTDGPATPEAEVGPSPGRRAGATIAAIIPGAVIHGSGHFVLGERRTARQLVLTQLGGLAAVGAGVTTLRLSRGDESLAVVYAPLIVVGGTVLVGTFLADLLGVVSPRDPTPGDRALRPGEVPAGSLLSLGLGYRFADHPNLDVGHMARADVAARAGPVRLEAAVDIDVAGTYHQERVVAAVRTGWRPAGAAQTEVGVDVAVRQLVGDGVTSIPFALWFETLWELRNAVPRLAGGYARVRAGAGAEMVRYGAGPGSSDLLHILVAEAGLGFRFGRLESELNYDHRQDGLPGGAWTPRAPGMLGSFGLSGRLRLADGWALAGEARYGTGVTAWTALQRSF